MRIWISSIVLLLAGSAAQARAQAAHSWELAGSYTYVHSNAPPGGCGCFSMNGGGGDAAYRLSSHLSLAGDVSVAQAGSIPGANHSFTLTSYQAGPRLYVPVGRQWTAFTHVLVGGAHSGGSAFSGTSSSTNAFAATLGGGLQVNLSRAVTLRAIDADYFLTEFPNGSNDHQNNLRLSVGIVVRVGRRSNTP
jgi:outer membrane immunogenic protein